MGAIFALILALAALAPVASQVPGDAGAVAEATPGAVPAAGDAAAAKAAAKAQDKAAPAPAGGGAGQWGAAPAAAGAPTAGSAPEFVAEEQVATGKFLTALEVKPIMTATRGSWIALREYDGRDLLYFTQVLSWRCGLHQIRFAVNGGPEEVLEMQPCYADEAAPGAIKPEGPQPYLEYPLGSVQSVALRLIYDDNTEDGATFDRAAVLMP